MSAEKIIYIEEKPSVVTTSLIRKAKITGRVDINDLLKRARKKEEKENKINLIFFGLITALVVIVGILLSL